MNPVKESVRLNEKNTAGDIEPRDIAKIDRLIVVLLTVVTAILLFRPLIANFNIWRGNQYAHAGQVDEAARAYRKAILLDAGNAGAHDGLGYTYEARGRFNKAIAEYKKAVKLAPNEAFHHYILGLTLMRRQNNRLALGPLREAARLEPNNFNHLRALASVYQGLGREREAREVLDEISKRFNGDSGVQASPSSREGMRQ